MWINLFCVHQVQHQIDDDDGNVCHDEDEDDHDDGKIMGMVFMCMEFYVF